MKIRIANYQSLANKFLEKAEKADEKKLFKLSSKYFSIAQKIYKIANSDLTEKINQNKNVIREYNRNNLEQFIEDQPNKQEIYAFFESLEFPYEIHFGNTSTENRKQEAIRIINLALNLHRRGESSDIALALSHFQYNISGIQIDMETDTEELLNFIEQRKQKYGFVGDRRMDFRTPTLLIEIHRLTDAPNETLPLVSNRREFLNLMYSESDNFSFDLEHFGSALTFNYIFGKQSIPFAQKCQSEYFGNPIVDIPHMIDNELSLDKLEYDEKIGKFIIDNYFKANVRKTVEEFFKTTHRYRSEEKNKSLIAELFDPKNELTGVDIYGTIWKLSDFTRLALPKLRSDIALIIKNWHSDVQIGQNDFKTIKDISNYSIEKLSKIIEDDITAQKIGYENITNYPLYEAMKKYQKDDIDSFLKVQDYFDGREESNWYIELSKLKVENDSYIARLLPKNDLRFPFVGAITGCCQKIRGHGEAAFIDTFYQDSGILIVTDKRDNIVSQSYVWINEGTITLDSIESLHTNLNIEDFKDIYVKACEHILGKKFDVVLCGSDNNRTESIDSNKNRIIPLDVYPNNAPKVYTYDTENGRSILYANPETIDQYPYISLMDKAKNNLIKPFTAEEIEIIYSHNDIYNNIEKILVNNYINEIDDVVNKNNLVSFYLDYKNINHYHSMDNDLMFLCQTLNDAPLDFGISLNLTQFQIFLNKWLRDGGYINLHKQDESLDRDFHYIQQYIHEESFEPTNLYKTQKIIFASSEEIDRDHDVANFMDNLQPTEKESVLKMLANNMSFFDILNKLQVETPEDLTTTKGAFGSYKPVLFKFLPSLIGTYIENNKFSSHDMEKVQELNIFKQYMAYQIGPMIDKGILNYYFQTDEENKQIIPTEDELNSISYYISKNDPENIPFVTEFANRFMNNIPELPEMLDDEKLSHYSLIELIATLIKKQITNININDYNIQKIIFAGYSYHRLEGLITDKINTVYASLDLYRIFTTNLIAPEINLIVDEDKNLYSVAIKISQLDTIQKVDVIVQAPLSLNEQMAKDLRYAKEKINYRNEDLIKLIQNYVNPYKIASTYNNYKSYENNASFKDYALVNLRSELYELTYGQIDKVETELEQIVNQRVNEYLSQFQPTPTQPITTPEPQQPEEQKEITAKRKTSRYTIKQK